MKKTVKNILALSLATIVIAAGQLVSLAAVSSEASTTSAADTSAVSNTPNADEISGIMPINESPNTGVGMARMIAAALAIGSVPVIFAASRPNKKK